MLFGNGESRLGIVSDVFVCVDDKHEYLLMFLCVILFSELRLKVHLTEEVLSCQIVLFIPLMADE